MNRIAAPQAPFAKPASTSKLEHPADATSTTLYSAYATSAPPTTAARLKRPISKAAPGVALFAPIHYERRYAYPLLIWLHGDNSSERELRQLMPLVSVRNYVGAAARGAAIEEPNAHYTWRQTAADVDAAADSVAQCIEHAQNRYHIHPDRIYVAGHGAGGTMALRLALGFSLPLAGAVSLGGALPRGNCPLARVNEARRLPLLLMSCRGSETYPPQRVAEDLRLLHAAGCQLAIREYLCGDELFTDMFTDLDQWLMERVCGAPVATPA
jgi:phospholipase/carboxylesterase